MRDHLFFFFFIPPFWNLACKWIPPQEPWFHLSFGTSFPHWVVLKEGHQCISKVSSGGSCSHESTKCFFPLPTYSSTLPRTRWRSRSVPKSPGTRRCPWCQSPYFSPSGWCSTRTPFCVWSMSTNLWRWIVVGADVDVVLLIKTRLKKEKDLSSFSVFLVFFFCPIILSYLRWILLDCLYQHSPASAEVPQPHGRSSLRQRPAEPHEDSTLLLGYLPRNDTALLHSHCGLVHWCLICFHIQHTTTSYYLQADEPDWMRRLLYLRLWSGGRNTEGEVTTRARHGGPIFVVQWSVVIMMTTDDAMEVYFDLRLLDRAADHTYGHNDPGIDQAWELQDVWCWSCT